MGERARYLRVLQVFAAFLPAWESAVAAALPARWGEWLRARSRQRFLRQDLEVLGVAEAPAPVFAPSLPGAAAAWGSLYVMEGSALGGQVITRHLAEAGLHPHSGGAFFHGWGEATGAMWREFRGLLDQQVAEPAAIAQACDAARLTFDLLTFELEGALNERTAAA